uniref:pyocin knob domain-containing protein n=1 Tax=uncultured Methanobrevibacter sp. TaxID=253161 RepID=UPI00262B137D
GAEIDDTSTAYSTTWSSNKINDEISSMPDNLSELDDVALANITDGQMLAYDLDNHRWKNKTADASSLNYEAGTSIKDKIDEKANTADLAEVATGGQLIDLSDVDVSSPSANDALVWDDENEKWIAGSVSTVGSIDDLTDVDTANASAGDCLRYDADNSEWIAQKQVIELTQAEYDALVSKQPNTLYVITDAWNLNATADDIELSAGVSVADKIETIDDDISDIQTDLVGKFGYIYNGTAIVDLNDIKDNGIYSFYNPTNRPYSGNAWAQIIVIRAANEPNYATQICLANNNTPTLHIRVCTNGSWQSWVQVV